MRALPFLMAVPLVAVPAAYLVLSDRSDGGSLPVARGATGGVLHPVAGTFDADATRLERCGANPRCLEQAFGNVAFRQGPRPALALFSEGEARIPAARVSVPR